jgi:hypothetical protein
MVEALCPICLQLHDLEKESDLYRRSVDGQVSKLDLTNEKSPLLAEYRKRHAWKRCPGSDSGEDHYLPADYAAKVPPLAIGFVGATETGKSHLLAAMIGGVQYAGLTGLDLHHDWLAPEWHDNYLHERVSPFFDRSKTIERDAVRAAGQTVEFSDAFLVRRKDADAKRAVAFFDVAGGDLVRADAVTNFMLAVDALVFVVDVGRARAEEGSGRIRGDQSFIKVLDRLEAREPAGLTPGRRLPAAIVLTKADERQFERPVMRWLRQPELAAYRRPEAPDLDAINKESRDAYGYLYKSGLRSWLEPVNYFERSTLHFVSATGSPKVYNPDSSESRYPLGVRPQRTLDPLAAILAMAGLFGDYAANEVGR